MRLVASLVVLLIMLMSSAVVNAITYTVGACSGWTHSDLETAWDIAAKNSGPHTIRLCPGTHTSPALVADWGHAGITLTSIPGISNASETTLTVPNISLTSQAYNVIHLTVKSSFSSTGNAVFRNSILEGSVVTSGTLTIEHSTINGDIRGGNGITITNTDQLISGNITATNGRIEITGGRIEGNIDTLGNSQRITLTGVIVNGYIATQDRVTISNSRIEGELRANNGVEAENSDITGDITATNGTLNITGGTLNGHIKAGPNAIELDSVEMTGGSITVGANNIILRNSSLGSATSRIPVVAVNEVKVYNSTIWGDISAAKWHNQTIYLDSLTDVYGYCDPAYHGGGRCQPGDGPGGGDDGGSGGSCDVQLHLEVDNHIAGAAIPISLEANIQEGEDGCFDGEQEIAFYSKRINPDTPAPSESRTLQLNNTSIAADSPGTALTVEFSNNSATLSLVYPDAGHMQLYACLENTCSYAGFIARPAGFLLEVPDNPGTVSADGSVFRAAGAEFQMLVTALGANDERLPNFGREQTPAAVLLNHDLVAPVGGINPGLAGSFGSFGRDCNNNPAAWGTACGRFSWPEVGAITITPRIAGGFYLDSDTPNIIGPDNIPVGRFVPHHFSLLNTTIDNRSVLACSPASDFTYLGEDFRAHFQLQARALDDSPTRNYTDAFARLPASGLHLAALHESVDLTAQLSQQSVTINWLLGTADIELALQMARTTSAADFTPAGPWQNLQLGLRATDADGVTLKSSELTLDVDGNGHHDHGLLGETDLRFGRLQVDNALGSELGPLRLPVTAQYWNGNTWINNTEDSCTQLSLANQVQLNDSVSGTTAVSVGSGESRITNGDLQLSDGQGFIEFSAPGSAGYVDVELLLDAENPDYLFLQDDLDADGNYNQNPGGRASWGLYPGNNRTILMLEALP